MATFSIPTNAGSFQMSFTAKGEATPAVLAPAGGASVAAASGTDQPKWKQAFDTFPIMIKWENPLTLLKSPRFYRALVGEFVATMMFLAVTVGVVISTNYDDFDFTPTTKVGGAMTGSRHLMVALTFGLMITILVFVFAPVSGANINPAVTICLVVSRALDPITAICYIVMQCLGAMAGCGLVKAVSSHAYTTHGGGANSVNATFGTSGAVLAEILATFLLCFTVCAAVDGSDGSIIEDARSKHTFAFTIGFAVFLAHLWLVPIDGTSINPARSFGAAVVHNKWDDHWVFWVGPIVGGILAALVYQILFNEHWMRFLEGEARGEAPRQDMNPVNPTNKASPSASLLAAPERSDSVGYPADAEIEMTAES